MAKRKRNKNWVLRRRKQGLEFVKGFWRIKNLKEREDQYSSETEKQICDFSVNSFQLIDNTMMVITPLTQVSNLLVTLNSSVNFIIYIIYGEKFQRIFLNMFCRGQNRSMIRKYTTTTIKVKNGVIESPRTTRTVTVGSYFIFQVTTKFTYYFSQIY